MRSKYKDCILTWLKRNNICPICKTEITAKSFQKNRFMENPKVIPGTPLKYRIRIIRNDM